MAKQMGVATQMDVLYGLHSAHGVIHAHELGASALMVSKRARCGIMNDLI